uniref:30S ribosomal protein S6 n=1 Tax=Candidatus Palauibacter polyketidifaciens TaxID=3056740 RepID=UPI0023A2FEA6
MRDYEIVYIFRVSLTSEEIEAKLKRYQAIITADGSGEVTASVHWGKRQLAYPIQKQPNGYYVVARFTSSPDPLQELERALKLEDDVLRYLIVIQEHPWPLPDPAP